MDPYKLQFLGLIVSTTIFTLLYQYARKVRIYSKYEYNYKSRTFANSTDSITDVWENEKFFTQQVSNQSYRIIIGIGISSLIMGISVLLDKCGIPFCLEIGLVISCIIFAIGISESMISTTYGALASSSFTLWRTLLDESESLKQQSIDLIDQIKLLSEEMKDEDAQKEVIEKLADLIGTCTEEGFDRITTRNKFLKDLQELYYEIL